MPMNKRPSLTTKVASLNGVHQFSLDKKSKFYESR